MTRLWVALMTAMAVLGQNSPPCSSVEARAFDFWVGSWTVQQPGGKKLGENKIERLLGGCVLMENWRGAMGREGKSWNYWHAASRTWKQHWVDAAGQVTEYIGVPTANGKRFEAETDGVVNVMTFTRRDDGTVEQKIEISGDGRKTWTSGFLGIYSKR
ncbi:MAG: hypothetical protein ABI972_17945 [Acidobacteriota bacterium]